MNETKRQVLPAGLWVVATPIGNLGDITFRAISALTEADAILCEDTRRTAVLLSALGITGFKSRLERVDSYTTPDQMHHWVETLKSGKSCALVTDAGTPAISDPGSALVACAREAGIRITPLPGASAVLALLSISGFQGTSFTFRGFFPRKVSDQRDELQQASISSLSHIYVWFESPFRMSDTLTLISEIFPEVPVLVAKELTKIHERSMSGKSEVVAELVRKEILCEGAVGEWCFAIQFPKLNPSDLSQKYSSSDAGDWIKATQCLLEARISVSETAKRVSQAFGVPRKASYEAALRISGKKTVGGD